MAFVMDPVARVMAAASLVGTRRICLLVILACVGCGCSAGPSSNGSTRDVRVATSTSQHPNDSVDHLFNFDLRPFFHASRTKQGTLHATPVEPLDRAKWHDWLAPELRKYSMELFYPCFHVYPCDVLEINGRRSGGTVWRLGVVIADPRDARSGARFFATYTLHHEVATWLLLGYDFESWDEWFAVIPLGFEYLDDEAEADRRGWGAPGIADEALLKRGFVTQYAQVSMDNDFAEICAHLFMSQPEFWAAFDRYEAIRTKATLAIEFFASLDPRFSESYFRSLSPPGGERSGSAGG